MSRRIASWIGAGALAVLSVFAIVQNAGHKRAGLARRHGPSSVSVQARDHGGGGTHSPAVRGPAEPRSRSSAPLVILVGLAVAVGALVSRRPRTWDRVGP
jgi:hypothetical protein